MNRSLVVLLLAAAFLRPIAATSSQRTSELPFRPGEQLTYDVSWSSFLTAGEATLSVSEHRTSGAPAYDLVAEGRTVGVVASLYTLSYTAGALLDVASLLPIRSSVHSQEGRRTRDKITTFDRRASRVAYEVHTATVMTKDLWAPRDSLDAVSALYVLRTLPLSPGTRHSMTVCDSAQLFRLIATVEARETLETALGPVATLRIRAALFNDKGEAQNRSLLLWVSEDARRLPLKFAVDLSVGSVVLTLRRIGR